jgi:hypothetical protein
MVPLVPGVFNPNSPAGQCMRWVVPRAHSRDAMEQLLAVALSPRAEEDPEFGELRASSHHNRDPATSSCYDFPVLGAYSNRRARVFHGRVPQYGIDALPDDLADCQERVMTDKKNWGSTVLGWFVVHDETRASPENINTEAGAPDTTALDATFAKDVPMAKGGQVDFEAVFDAAGIDPEIRGHCAKAADLLATLPTQADPAIKKQIVEASLKAFGVPIAKIIEAGVHEVQALEGYIQADSRDTRKVIEESQRRIAQHDQEIAQIKTVMAQRGEEQQAVVKACNDRKLEIQRVLEFFGREAVARVVSESPKLTSPSDLKKAK